MLLWGDLHNHCGITYGFGSLQNALKIARSHLDFRSEERRVGKECLRPV